MSTASAFRALLITQWILPFLSVALDLWIPDATFASTPLDEPRRMEQSSVESLAFDLLGTIVIVTALVATVGRYRFRRWGPRLYAAALVAYGAFVAASEPVALTGGQQVLFLIDGALCGAVATWLILARDRLPFPKYGCYGHTQGRRNHGWQGLSVRRGNQRYLSRPIERQLRIY